MNKILSAGVALAALLFAHNALAKDAKDKEKDAVQSSVTLKVGHSQVLDVAGMGKVAIGDPDVADIKPVGENQLLVVGIKEGKTTLRVTTKNKEFSWAVTVVSAGAESASGADQSPKPDEVISLKVGEKVSRPVAGMQRLAIGDPAIADIKVSDAGVDVTGKAPGSTTMLMWMANGTRQVFEVRVTK
jgi:Flp pilus assembly secretin CpaC